MEVLPQCYNGETKFETMAYPKWRCMRSLQARDWVSCLCSLGVLTAHTGLGLNSFIFVLPKKSIFLNKEVFTYAHKERKNPKLLASVMWSLWHRRNQVRTSPKEYPLSQVAPTTIQALDDFQRVNSIDASQPRSFSQSWTRWSPLLEGDIKVNFDGAQFRDMGKAGLGVVIRDSRGQALASLSEQASLPFSPEIVKAMAAARAIYFAQGLGFTSFILEGDSTQQSPWW